MSANVVQLKSLLSGLRQQLSKGQDWCGQLATQLESAKDKTARVQATKTLESLGNASASIKALCELLGDKPLPQDKQGNPPAPPVQDKQGNPPAPRFAKGDSITFRIAGKPHVGTVIGCDTVDVSFRTKNGKVMTRKLDSVVLAPAPKTEPKTEPKTVAGPDVNAVKEAERLTREANDRAEGYRLAAEKAEKELAGAGRKAIESASILDVVKAKNAAEQTKALAQLGTFLAKEAKNGTSLLKALLNSYADAYEIDVLDALGDIADGYATKTAA